MAVKTLSEWPREAWPADAVPAVEEAARVEPVERTRDTMYALREAS